MGWLETKLAASGGASRQPGETQSDYEQRRIDAYNERIAERKKAGKGTRNLEERRDRCVKHKRFYDAQTPEEVEALKDIEGVKYATPETPRVQRKVHENYRGYDIIYSYDPSTDEDHYGVSIEGKYDKFDTPEEAQARIDRYHYEHSPVYLQEKAAEKKRQQEFYSERARIYGIGTDSKGNPIPPTQDEIDKREEYYAKERLIRGTTIREEYELEHGITITPEEQARREAALIEEAEEQGLPGNIYLLQLNSELRKLYWILVNITRSFTG